MRYNYRGSCVKSLVFHLLVDYKNLSAVLKLERGSIENRKWVNQCLRNALATNNKNPESNGQAEVGVTRGVNGHRTLADRWQKVLVDYRNTPRATTVESTPMGTMLSSESCSDITKKTRNQFR